MFKFQFFSLFLSIHSICSRSKSYMTHPMTHTHIYDSSYDLLFLRRCRFKREYMKSVWKRDIGKQETSTHELRTPEHRSQRALDFYDS